MRWPPAKAPIDEALIRRLLEDQQPDLARLPLQLVDAGWDNVMWRLGEDLAVRVPRRAEAAPLIENELRWVPELARRLPLPVPVPIRAGQPSAYYPWSWLVVPWIEGDPGDRVPARDVELSAERLGAFLRAMHRPAPAGAPFNPYRSGPVESRVDTFEERMAKLADHVDEPPVRKLWDAGLSGPLHAGPPLWLHGDLHPANTLVRDGAVVAVIDFGDLCAGDPAVDIGAAWMTVEDRGEAAFWAAYGPARPGLVERSRAWAVLFALMLLEIGLEDRPTYAAVGRSTLERLSRSSPG